MSILPASGMGDESTGFYPFEIDQSLRFDDGSNCRMSVTVGDGSGSGGGDRRTFTLSVWIKRTNPAGADRIFEGYTSASQYTGLGFDSSGRLRFDRLQDGVTNTVYSNDVFRDTTNWGHFVWAIDTEQSTASDRVRFYVNGTEITDKGSSGSGYPSQNLNTIINLSGQSTVHAIGKFGGSTGANFDGYMAEMNFIDGTQLTPSSFGETKNGVWIPKDVSGLTYGTLGFRLTFADSSDLGNNANSTDGTNDFTTVSNLDSTDVVLDSPTNNFCTLQQLNTNDHRGEATLSRGALRIESTSTNRGFTTGTMKIHGKVYFEVLSHDGNNGFVGIQDITNDVNSSKGQSLDFYLGTPRIDGTALSNTGTFSDDDIMGVAVDVDAKSIQFFRNNSSVYSGNYTTDAEYFPFIHDSSGGRTMDAIANFGQDSSFCGEKTSGSNNAQDSNGKGDFYYAPPSGFLALCAANLPNVAIGADRSTQPTDHFGTAIWSGNATARDISLGFQADWVWTKMRSHDNAHYAFDSVRGDDAGLYPNLSQQEGTVSGAVSFGNTDGFTLGTNAQVNGSGYTFVGWSWKAGGEPTADNSAGAGNTPTSNSVKIDGSNLGSALAGTIPATRLSANTTAGFSIVTYTGTGTQSDTVAHGLGVKPAWYFTKSRSEAQNWHVYHEELDSSAPEDYVIFLNASNARASSSANYWNSTAPTTSVVSVGVDNSSNKNGVTYVMYCFANVDGYSKFGTYDGNSNADGALVYTGFRPAMVIFKATHSDSWVIADNKRDPQNQVNGQLFPDLSNPESTSNAICDFLSNGFKLRRNAGSINQNTYIYMAFAEQTFKFSNAR